MVIILRSFDGGTKSFLLQLEICKWSYKYNISAIFIYTELIWSKELTYFQGEILAQKISSFDLT